MVSIGGVVHRGLVVAQEQDQAIAHFFSQGAAAWSRLTDDQKLPYNQKYEAEKEKYNTLLQNMVRC